MIKLPITRYYGSKRKLVEKIWSEIERLDLQFDSVLDIFGGTGIFSYYAKSKGKQVTYNDIFTFNSFIGRKLIEQNHNALTYEAALELLQPVAGRHYENYIEANFEGIYFTDEENRQIDIFVQNAMQLEDENARVSAYYILFQSCIIKRPYNLFHRNNLNMRVNYSGGNFGNKVTWERTFEELFARFITELDNYTFDNGRHNTATNFDALRCPARAELLYIDPPYFGKRGHTTYHAKYHLLEGLANYNEIPANIDFSKSNREIRLNKNSQFERPSNFLTELEELINNHIHSIIVISYRNNGVPCIEEITALMIRLKQGFQVHTIDLGSYGYALNKTNSDNNEFLIIGTNTVI
jgi:adenine-specific DNA-methyltransferase